MVQWPICESSKSEQLEKSFSLKLEMLLTGNMMRAVRHPKAIGLLVGCIARTSQRFLIEEFQSDDIDGPDRISTS